MHELQSLGISGIASRSLFIVPGFKNISNLPFNAVYFPAVEKVLQLPIEKILDPALNCRPATSLNVYVFLSLRSSKQVV